MAIKTTRGAVVARALVGIFTRYLLTLLFLAALGPLRVAPFVSEVQPGVLVPTAVTWVIAMAISMAASLTLPSRYLSIWIAVIIVVVILAGAVLASALGSRINCGTCYSKCGGHVHSCSMNMTLDGLLPTLSLNSSCTCVS